MSVRRLLPGLISGIALTLAIYLPASCLAQSSSNAQTSEPNVDAPECSNLTVFPKLAASVVVSCQSGKSVSVNMPLKPDAQGFAREKSIRGVYEYREYRITLIDQQEEQSFESLMQLIPMAGFIAKYSVKPSTITARNGDTWILININNDSYNVSVVREVQEPWTPVKTAEEISQEMEAHKSVAIYGIQFAPKNQTIQENGSAILNEVLKYLRQNPNLAVVIESHKVTTNGTEESDLKTTSDRANAVVAWLVAHGIAAGRLQAKPFGRSRPLTENDSAIEIQRNERITLAKPEV
ncbi:MAG TPA: OmpA family protein [Candidatus Acidoferrum sp.]